MRKKYFKLLFLLVLCLSLISCGKKEPSPKDDLTLVLPDGKSITLYMDREEVEKIIGEPTGEPQSGLNNYGIFEVGYTENKLTLIYITEEGCQTKSGISVGTDLETLNSKGFGSKGGERLLKYYIYMNNTFSTSEEPENIDALFTNATLHIFYSENKIKYIMIIDALMDKNGKFDDL